MNSYAACRSAHSCTHAGLTPLFDLMHQPSMAVVGLKHLFVDVSLTGLVGRENFAELQLRSLLLSAAHSVLFILWLFLPQV